MLLPIVLEKTKLLPIYVIGMGIKEHQTRKYREQGFAGFQLLYCTSGSGVFVIEGKEFIIECGDAFFFRPEVPHEYYPTSDIWKTRWVAFLGSSAANIMDYLDFGNYEVFKLSHFEEFDIQMNALWDMFWCDEPDKEIKTSMLMYKMIIKMGDCKNSQTLEGDL
ncbi:MAG: AraC family ligand binding domain-containing protein, partial [Oscillospiraceae bacterium]